MKEFEIVKKPYKKIHILTFDESHYELIDGEYGTLESMLVPYYARANFDNRGKKYQITIEEITND